MERENCLELSVYRWALGIAQYEARRGFQLLSGSVNSAAQCAHEVMRTFTAEDQLALSVALVGRAHPEAAKHMGVGTSVTEGPLVQQYLDLMGRTMPLCMAGDGATSAGSGSRKRLRLALAERLKARFGPCDLTCKGPQITMWRQVAEARVKTVVDTGGRQDCHYFHDVVLGTGQCVLKLTSFWRLIGFPNCDSFSVVSMEKVLAVTDEIVTMSALFEGGVANWLAL